MTAFFFTFDPLYFLYVGPFLLLALYAQWHVKGTFARYSQVGLRSRISGAEAAQLILRGAGIHGVRVEAVAGMLSDHYDPTSRTVRLSEDVLNARSAAAVAVAAHEVGHAIQHAQAYQPLQLRSALVGPVQLVNSLALPMFLIGMFLSAQALMVFGLVLFGATLLFHLVTLPVEFDASARAIRILEGSGLVAADEMDGVRKTLYAAGFTYLAATLVAASQLVYWLVRSGLLGGRSDED
ncbi:MAG: zinc metallopeptidase [Planctomycetota bacterium]|nr:zinc metallopeptidase [Planctomycetota bacterium]MDA0933047.1 zinc metallopeptidase [Planctomycetota bacterium]